MVRELSLTRESIKRWSMNKKRHWFWNILVVVSVLLSLTALGLHLQNYIQVSTTEVGFRSGFYHEKIPYSRLDSAVLVSRIPPMERLHGFSALAQEKGVFREFKDSLRDKKVYVFVDNIESQKIKLVYKDSHYLYVNLKDSLATLDLLRQLQKKTVGAMEPN